jgi:hypothetical protein
MPKYVPIEKFDWSPVPRLRQRGVRVQCPRCGLGVPGAIGMILGADEPVWARPTSHWREPDWRRRSRYSWRAPTPQSRGRGTSGLEVA